MTRTWFVSIEARCFCLSTRGSLNGADLDTIDLDPRAVRIAADRRLP